MPGVVGDVPGGGAVVPVDGGTPVVTGGTVETVDSVTDGGVVVVTVQRKQTRHGAMGRAVVLMLAEHLPLPKLTETVATSDYFFQLSSLN